MPPHLLIVSPSAYPLGGVAVWLAYLAPGLEVLGWRITVALTRGRFHDAGNYVEVYPGLEGKVVEVANPTGSWQGRINVLRDCFRAHDPDIVLVANVPDAYRAVNVLRQEGGRPGCRVAMAIHGSQYDLLQDMALYSGVLDAVICTNRLTLAMSRTMAGIEDARLHYASCGVKLVREEDTRLWEKARQRDSCLRIAWVGRLEQPQKRARDLVAVVEQLQRAGVSFRLAIAGAGPEEQWLRDRLDLQAGRELVEFCGVVPPERVADRIYAPAHVLLLTSFWETGPIVLWEAMAAGVAVVSSRYIGSGLEGALRHGENCLLFPRGDTAEAARQLGRIAADPALRLRLCRGGRDLVRRRYSIPVSVRSWDQALRAVLGRPPRGAVDLPPLPVSGRLDRILGPRLAERLRSACGISFTHGSPGGEWPHSHCWSVKPEADFWDQAAHLDAGGSIVPGEHLRDGH